MTSSNELKIDRLTEFLKTSFSGYFSANVMGKIGERAAEQIRLRTRLGYGVRQKNVLNPNDLPNRTRLPALSDRYVLRRRGDLRRVLSEKTRAGKSNLTLTGQMLDDLRAIDAKKGEIMLGFRSHFSRQKAEWAQENKPSRSFLGLAKNEFRILQRFVKQGLTDHITRRTRGKRF